MKSDTIIVGDVGGTNCRFSLAQMNAQGTIELSNTAKLGVSEYPSFYEALDHYLKTLETVPKLAAFALAGPKFNGAIRMTNLNWEASESEIKSRFDFDMVTISNDFAAMARGAAIIPDDGFRTIIEGKVNYSNAVAVFGPGTGLGVAGILPGKPLRILPTEGGYSAFAPQDDLEDSILKKMRADLGFVASEHILSGPGLLRTYIALCAVRGETPISTQPDEVVAAAESNPKSLAREAVRVFCNVLGGFAGNTAYTLGASGGVIIAGGVARHIAPFIAASDFETRFKSRGKASWFTQNIPVRLLTAHSVALYGAAAFIIDRNG
jgi:glucokinase